MNKTTVLIVDDEPDICELLSITLTRMGLNCDIAYTYQQALEKIKAYSYELVLSDMRLPDGDGINLVKYIQKHKPHLPVAMITAYGNVEGAVNTLKAGAFDYVSKPIDLPILKSLVQTALSMNKKLNPNRSNLLIGHSQVIQELRLNIEKLARSQAPVFIYGESGVGKELVARLIHQNGPRADKPFIPVNCGAIPNDLMESEFFGHKKGSFTGAIADKTGLFEAAKGGTLFLDEIAELPMTMQVKLLRAIQEKAIKPIGSYQEIPVDVRILSASNKNLQQEIHAGTFRQDLYYRINVIELYVPSLKERPEDISLIANHLLNKLSQGQNRGSLTLTEESLQRLQAYPFPGNVRELENILERAVALSDNTVIQVEDLRLPPVSSYEDISTIITNHLDNSLNNHEKDLIIKALEETRWNRTAAAKLLGVSFRTLRYRLKKLGLDPEG